MPLRAPTTPPGASLQLAAQANRLVTSDVIWADLFRTASLVQMRADGVSGVPVPESDFVQNPEFGSPGYWEPVFERVNGAATDGGTTVGGLHGTGIVETRALPSGVVLSTDTDNIVTAGTDLAFAVTIEDTGDAQEVQIKVTLTIEQQPSPIVATKTIDSINPGESKTVTFSDLGQVAFATETTVKVDVQPVEGEANADNNSASYPVIFSWGNYERRQEEGGTWGRKHGFPHAELCLVPRDLLARLVGVSFSSDVAGGLAVVAAVVARLALVLLIAIMRDIRRLRAAQSVLLGGAQRDLADFAVSLQTRVDDLHRAVDEVTAATARVDRRPYTSLGCTAVVRSTATRAPAGASPLPWRCSIPTARASS